MGSGVSEFGKQTLTFVSIAEGLENRDRLNKPAEIHTETAVPGCRFWPPRRRRTAPWWLRTKEGHVPTSARGGRREVTG